ncbi:MAG: hypothetical protein CSB33_03245 [Desulfobacterales bacterium]|nr:MAG: hypothetical protein CSB33_03245 [Desulfobacterales bacterium]
MNQEKMRETEISAVMAVHAAVRNMHLYPISSSSVILAMDKAYQALGEALARSRFLEIQEIENRLIVCGHPLQEGEQNKPQLSACLDLFLSGGIRLIRFRSGLARAEFFSFLEFLSVQTKDPAREKAGISRNHKAEDTAGLSAPDPPFREADFPHITFRHHRFAGDHAEEGAAGIADPSALIATDFTSATRVLDFLLNEAEQDAVVARLVSALLKKDSSLIALILIQPMEGRFAARFREEVLKDLDDELFGAVIQQIHTLYLAEREKTADEHSVDMTSLKSAFDHLLQTKQGVRFQRKWRQEKVATQERKRQHTLNTLLGISDILNGKLSAFQNENLMNFLPDAVRRLRQGNQEQVADNLIKKLGEALGSRQARIRQLSSRSLLRIIENQPVERRLEAVAFISGALCTWMRVETEVTPVYTRMAVYLKGLVRQRIADGRYQECAPILEAFNAVFYSRGLGGEEKRKIALEMLKRIGTDDIFSILLGEIGTGNEATHHEVVNLLTRMGGMAVHSMLKILKESENRRERARVLNLLSDIGAPVLGMLQRQIQDKSHPWYFIRNLLLLFGKKGNPAHVGVVRPFLSHPDIRVQREAVNAVMNIGGIRREDIFLDALEQVDGELVTEVIRLLGRLKSRKAAGHLLSFIAPDNFRPSRESNQLAEAACRALGDIGASEALESLDRIAGQKKLALSPGGGGLQTAAAAAAELIRKKEPKPGLSLDDLEMESDPLAVSSDAVRRPFTDSLLETAAGTAPDAEIPDPAA